MIKVSIGIPTYNEEKNIGKLLENLSQQKLRNTFISEIIIIESGSKDSTLEIIKKAQKKNKKIKIIIQKKREGKSAADTLFINKSTSKILVLVGADVLFKNNCLETAVSAFSDPKIGVVGIRIIPLNNKQKLAGYFSHLWWKLFNCIAKKHFRAGEIILFRKVFDLVPSSIGSDEVYITDQVLQKGYKAKYLPKAIAYNMGPDNLHDILLMRRKHNWLTYQIIDYGLKKYFPKTLDNKEVLRFFITHVNWSSPKEVIFAVLSALIEILSRLLARYDYHFTKKSYFLWPQGKSTKRLYGNLDKKEN